MQYTKGMSKGGLITLLGFLLALMPFLGIPSVVKITLAVIFGVAIMALGFLVREEKRWLLRALSGDHQADAYTENSARVGGESYATQTPEHST